MNHLFCRNLLLFGFAALCLSLLSSCSGAGFGVQPWQRDLHARDSMQFDAFHDGIDDHIYFSKESSSGGRSYGGGGCGCN